MDSKYLKISKVISNKVKAPTTISFPNYIVLIQKI